MEGIGNENSVTRKVYGRERSGGTDENGFLSNSMMISAANTVVLESIWMNRVAGNLCFSLSSTPASEIWFQPLHPDTNSLCTILQFYQQNDTDGMRSPWNLRVIVLKSSSQEVITVASKNENTVQHAIVGLPFKCHQGPWPRSCGWHLERGSPVWAHTPNFSVTEHVYVEEE